MARKKRERGNGQGTVAPLESYSATYYLGYESASATMSECLRYPHTILR